LKLSVVIPVYNRATLLPLTLRSLLSQDRVADEILVVDDGSTDGTPEVADAFGAPVRVIRQANQGPGAARNRGLAEAQGEFIHFFDSDDLALPNLHRLQLEALERSGADIAFSPWLKARLTRHQGVHPSNHVFQALGLPRGSLVRALLTNWSTVPITWLVRRRGIHDSSAFAENLRCGEDQLFLLSQLLTGARVLHTPRTLVLYRDESLDKLSAPTNPEAQQRQRRDWARSLVVARILCLQQGVDPARWFGFRRRAFLALQGLMACSSSDEELQADLLALVNAGGHHPGFYCWSHWIQQKAGGLAFRLSGCRAHRSFRCAPITSAQLATASDLYQGWMR